MADIDKTDDVGVKAERKPVDQGLRNFLKAVAAGGVGTALFGAGYLTGRRSIEEEFRQKFTEKMEQIHQLEQAIQDITSEKKELQAQLEKLVSDYDRAKADYNRAQDIIHLSDSLETETVEALSLYRTKEKEAINELYRIVARYTDKLGGDRVKAEKATADILSTTLVQRTKLEKTISEKQQEIEKLSKQVSEKQKEIEGLKAEINRLSNSWWSEVPLNPNGDFSEGENWWDPHPGGTLRNATWGYEIIPGKYGEIWLDNKDIDNWPGAALPQDVYTPKYGNLGGLPIQTWYLKGRRFILEADAMVVEDEPYDQKGWNRVAIVIMMKRIDGGDYNINGKVTPDLYTEYDIYRRNFPYYSYEDFISGNFKNFPTDVYEYHADQLPFGYWKPYKIDVTEFLQNGYNGIGGWGSEIYNISRIHAWYLVVENTAAKTTARWRKVKIYLEQTS